MKTRITSIALILSIVLGLLGIGCEKDNATQPVDDLYPSKVGRRFADLHFNETVYRDYEFQLAQSGFYGDSGVYTGSKVNWENEVWDIRIHYLPSLGFTYELPFDHDSTSNDSLTQLYYKYIGKYIHQFGFGWDDVFVLNEGQVVSYNGDNPGTPEYDDEFGAAQRSKYYMETYIEP